MSDDPNEPDDQNPGRLRTMYEEASRASAEAQARVAELERRDAFRDAGLDLKNPLQKMAADSYKGELNSDKVSEYIESLGLNTKPDDTPPPPVTTPEERAALERIAAAGQGDGVPAQEPDRVATLKIEMAEAARRGANPAELDRIAVELARATGNKVREF